MIMFLRNTKYLIFILPLILISCNLRTENGKEENKDKIVIDSYQEFDVETWIKKQKESERRKELWKKRRNNKRRNASVIKKYEEAVDASLEHDYKFVDSYAIVSYTPR